MRTPYTASLVCMMFFAANCLVWHASRPMRPIWANVPPVPSYHGAIMGALGDRQFAFRAGNLMLQNFGDIGGQVTPLYKYDFNKLKEWFLLEDRLDPHSFFTPYIAAFYYGGSQKGEEVRPVVDYLAMVGRRPNDKLSTGQNWRWLAQAVYLARFRLGDTDLALRLAKELAAMYEPGVMPGWVKQMPVYVLNARGDKAAAYALMMSILKDNGQKMQPQEVNSMIHYICRTILTPAEAAGNPVCTSHPEDLK